MSFIVTYKEFEKYSSHSNGLGIRSLLKNSAIETSNFFLGNSLYNSQLRKPRIQFIYFHHVFKDELNGLRKVLSRLEKAHDFLSYSDAIDKIESNQIDKPYIVFSSDDGFKNNLEASRIFEDFGISVCHFVNPGIVDESNYEKIKAHCAIKLNSPPIEFLNWDDLEDLKKRGHEIGSHSMNHLNLGNAQNDILEEEIVNSYDKLVEKLGEVSHFAFPYGRMINFNNAARKIVAKAGFTSCASAIRGCHFNHSDRINMDGLTLKRDHIIFDWKSDQILFFLFKNAINKQSSSISFSET